VSDFWWGVLALPLILVGLGLAVTVVLGGWLLAERWFERRTGQMNYEPDDTAHLRVRPATWVMAAPKLRRFRLGYGCTLLFVRGINRVSKDGWYSIEAALGRSVADIDRERAR
jgi:hypothetical protein